jgi:hypothetical protein
VCFLFTSLSPAFHKGRSLNWNILQKKKKKKKKIILCYFCVFFFLFLKKKDISSYQMEETDGIVAILMFNKTKLESKENKKKTIGVAHAKKLKFLFINTARFCSTCLILKRKIARKKNSFSNRYWLEKIKLLEHL